MRQLLERWGTKLNRISVIFLLPVALVGLVIDSCSKSPTDPTLTPNPDKLLGTWIYYRYEDPQAGLVRHSPKNLDEPVWVTFYSDSILTAKTTRNELFGTYRAFDNGEIDFSYRSTLVGELPWEYSFLDGFRAADHFLCNEDNLELYVTSTGEILTFIDSSLYDHQQYSQFNSSDAVYDLQEEFRRYFAVPPKGTAWVYQDQTGVIDTMWVRSRTDNYNYIFEDDAYFQWNSGRIDSKRRFHLFPKMQAVLEGTASNFLIYYPISFGYGVAYWEGDYQPSCPDLPIQTDSIRQDCNTTVRLLESITIGNAVYRDVIRVERINEWENRAIHIGYYAKDYGLVRKIHRDGAIFDLVSYTPSP